MKSFWQKYKKSRKAYYALIIFGVLFLLSLFAEFIANDKPLLVRYDGSYYLPIINEYAETEFGGDFDTEADYKDEYLQELITEKGGWMVFPLIEFSYKSINYNLPSPAPSYPTSTNLLGTDDQGRDVLARVIYGFRLSVLFGLLLTIFSALIGVCAGAIQGYVGGLLDLLFQRFIEIWSSMPSLYIIIIISGFITPNFWWLLLILLLFSWVGFVGVVRAECLKTRNMDYVTAARVMGLSDIKILFRHVLPNSLVATLTFMPFVLSGSITSLTALDFLGFGLPVGSPSLGELLAQGKANLEALWLSLTSFFTLTIMLMLLVFIGEGVRESLDVRG